MISKPSGNSYAIYVSSSNANLVIRNNWIQAGRGGSGAAGTSGGTGLAGTPGVSGSSNPTAFNAKIATGTGACNVSNNRQGASGGARTQLR